MCFCSLMLLFLCNVLINLHHAVLSPVSSFYFVKPWEVLYIYIYNKKKFWLVLSCVFHTSIRVSPSLTVWSFSGFSVLPGVTSLAQFREHLKLEQPHTAQTRSKHIMTAAALKKMFMYSKHGKLIWKCNFFSHIWSSTLLFWVATVLKHSLCFSGKHKWSS